jgi:hypothetical protein
MFRHRRSRPSAYPSQPDPTRAGCWPQPVEGVYLLFLNRPPDDDPPGDGGATVVAAASLRHPDLPQPDAERLFDRLTNPDRYPGALVFLSDLSADLAIEGLTWSQVGIDYEAVTDRLVSLHRRGAIPALRLTQLSDLAVTLLASGPHVQVHVTGADGTPSELFDRTIWQARREELRTMIRTDLENAVIGGSSR